MQAADMRAWRVLFAEELREFRFHPRAAHVVPAVMAGVAAAAWSTTVASVLLPVAAAVFAGLEPQFNNALARHPREREALALFPVPWTVVIGAKNCAAAVISLAATAVVLSTLAYFSGRPVSAGILADAALYLWTVLFPLLILGNASSVRGLRRECGLRVEDLVEAFWMLGTLAVVSVPYLLLEDVAPAALLVYGGGMCAAWIRLSIPRTARRIASSFARGGEEP